MNVLQSSQVLQEQEEKNRLEPRKEATPSRSVVPVPETNKA